MGESSRREPRAAVFLTDRAGAALRRRERCLALAGIAFSLESERRPSGVYFKLCVAERDAVDAWLALAIGGCGRAPRMQEPHAPALTESLAEVAGMLRDEATMAAGRVVDAVRTLAPQVLGSLRASDSDRG